MKSSETVIRAAMVVNLLSLLVLTWLVSVAGSGPVGKRDADFASVRTHQDKDYSARSGPEQKYFRMSAHPIPFLGCPDPSTKSMVANAFRR